MCCSGVRNAQCGSYAVNSGSWHPTSSSGGPKCASDVSSIHNYSERFSTAQSAPANVLGGGASCRLHPSCIGLAILVPPDHSTVLNMPNCCIPYLLKNWTIGDTTARTSQQHSYRVLNPSYRFSRPVVPPARANVVVLENYLPINELFRGSEQLSAPHRKGSMCSELFTSTRCRWVLLEDDACVP